MKNLLWIALVAVLSLTSCSSVQTNTDYDRNVNFSNYKTFSFYQKGLDSLKLNDLDKSRVTNSIIANLEKKGLKMVSNGDLLVNVLASYKDRNEVYSNNNNPYGWGPYGGYGGYGGNTYSRQYTEGRLTVDLIDRQKNTLVWQSLARGIDIDQLDRKADVIPKIVDKMFYNYPPKN